MTPYPQQRGFLIWAISLVAVGFGLLTIKEGGTILFGDEAMRAAAGNYLLLGCSSCTMSSGTEAARAAAGNYVPFVLWFNFLAGFAYVVAGTGLWLRQRWAVWLAIAIAAATFFAFAALGEYVDSGAAYEQRTVIAMSLRTLVWVVISTITWRGVVRCVA